MDSSYCLSKGSQKENIELLPPKTSSPMMANQQLFEHPSDRSRMDVDWRLQTIGNRRYRIAVPLGAKKDERVPSAPLNASAASFEEAPRVEEHSYTIKQNIKTQEYVSEERIPTAFHGFIIGKGGATIQRLQRETDCTIQIPRQQEQSDKVVFRAMTEAAVVAARSRVDIILATAAESMPYTHFLSLPVNSDQMQQKFTNFRQDVLKTCVTARGLDETIFQKPAKLHVTLVMLKLYSSQRVEQAVRILKEAASAVYDAVGTTSVVLTLSGLEIMNDDRSEVDVLYVKLKDDEALAKIRRICALLIAELRRADLLPAYEIEKQRLLVARLPQDEAKEKGRGGSGSKDGGSSKEQIGIKFHMTALNTRFRTGGEEPELDGGSGGGGGGGREKKEGDREQQQQQGGREGGKPRFVPRETFDATAVLKQYEGVSLGSERISALHLSIIREVDPDGGYYRCVHRIMLP